MFNTKKWIHCSCNLHFAMSEFQHHLNSFYILCLFCYHSAFYLWCVRLLKLCIHPLSIHCKSCPSLSFHFIDYSSHLVDVLLCNQISQSFSYVFWMFFPTWKGHSSFEMIKKLFNFFFKLFYTDFSLQLNHQSFCKLFLH